MELDFTASLLAYVVDDFAIFGLMWQVWHQRPILSLISVSVSCTTLIFVARGGRSALMSGKYQCCSPAYWSQMISMLVTWRPPAPLRPGVILTMQPGASMCVAFLIEMRFTVF